MGQSVPLEGVLQLIASALERSAHQEAEHYIFPALDQYPEVPALWFYAGVYFFSVGKTALAVRCFKYTLELEPNPAVYSNLGAALRRMGLIEDAIRALDIGLEWRPDDVSMLVNKGSIFVNEGRPDEGLPCVRKALELDPKNPQAAWNMGLMLLEKGEFAEGFDLYAGGAAIQRQERNFYPKAEPTVLTWENWKDFRGQQIVVWGEQGIGDELMFATILHEAALDFRIVLECHPRLERLLREGAWVDTHRRKWGEEPQIHPTRKQDIIHWPLQGEFKATAKCGIANLASIYRRDREKFLRGRGALTDLPFTDRTVYLRDRLQDLAGGRKIVGLAHRGGTMVTNRHYRTMQIEDLNPILSREDCMFVCMDYEDMAGVVQYVGERYGAERMLWFPSINMAWDYDHTADLVRACDTVVTVCQSLAHLCGWLGAPAHVLCTSKPAWRYGIEGSEWYWYPSMTLHRQQGNDWGPAVQSVLGRL